MARRAATAAAIVLAAAAAAAGWRALRPRPSDEEQVRALFAAAARAAEEKRVGDVMSAVSERFRGEGLDRQGLKQLVAFHALRAEWSAVAVLGSRVRVDGARAEATVDVALVRGGRGEALADRLPADASVERIDAELEREDSGWRVVAARWRSIAAADALAGPPP